MLSIYRLAMPLRYMSNRVARVQKNRRGAEALRRFCNLPSALRYRLRDYRARLFVYLFEMFLALEAFRVDFVDVLGAGRARGEPAVLRRHLEAVYRRSVARRVGQLRRYLLAREASRLIMKPSLSVLQTLPSMRRNDAPALSSPPKASEPESRPSTNHLKPTGTS